MSKSIVKKALEIVDDNDKQTKAKLNKNLSIGIKKTKKQERKKLIQKCLTLKKLSQPVVTSNQIEQLNNYRFGGPSKRILREKKKKEKEENIFTEEDFKRFEREYNPPLKKS